MTIIFFCFQDPGRLGFLITLYLITFNIYIFVSSAIAPPKRGFSYIEVWMTGVLITIGSAILELFFILAIKRCDKFSSPDKMVKTIDFMSLIITFISFFCFVIFYWTY